MASLAPPPRPREFSPLARALLDAAVQGSALVFLAPPPPPPSAMAEAAALGAACAILMAPVEEDQEHWLTAIEVGRRTLLRIAAIEDQRMRANAGLEPALQATCVDRDAWRAALEAIKPDIEIRQKAARALLVRLERFEGVVAADEAALRRGARTRVLRELQAAARAQAAMDVGPARAQLAASASTEAAGSLARLRAAPPGMPDAGAAAEVQARAKAALVAEGTAGPDPELVRSTADSLYTAVRADIDANLEHMRRLVALEGEALRRQAILQQLALEGAAWVDRALARLAQLIGKREAVDPELAGALAAAGECLRASGGAAAGYDSAVASAGHAEGLGAAAAAIVAALARVTA